MRWIRLFSSQKEAESRLVENKTFTVSIDSLKVCLLKTPKGIYAFKAFCPHAGASLTDAFCNSKNEIVCPLHGYRFDLISGNEVSGNSKGLSLYPLQKKEDGFYLGL